MKDAPGVAYNYYTKVIALVKLQRGLFLDLGKTLKDIKEEKLYKGMGDGGFDTWRSFLASPEISLNVSTADMYIKIYQFYVEKLQLPREQIQEIAVVRLNMMKAKLENSPETERGELLEKAKTLSYDDFLKEMVLNKAIPAQKIKIRTCDKCKKLQIFYKEDEMCMCDGIALNILEEDD